jgi:hypothetical protein
MTILDATISVAGQDYTGTTLGNVRLYRGREAVDVDTRAGYALCELIDLDGTGFPVDVADTITITLESSTGPVPLFAGNVADIQTRLYQVRRGARAIWQLVSSGSLATANRRQVLAGGTSVEFDGDLVLEVLRAGLRATWEEYQGTTWQAAGNVTWEDVDPGFSSDLIQTPGDYEIQPLDAQAQGYNALALLSDIAGSTGGNIFETGSGMVGYLSAYGRSERAAAGYVDLPSEHIVTTNLTAAKSLQDLINRLEVRYQNGTVSAQDADSISRYGVRESVLTTILNDQTDAEQRADDLLFDRATPRYKMPSVQFALHTLSDSDVDLLLSVDVETPVRIPGIPNTLGQVFTRAFVEGIQYDLAGNSRTLTLFVSDAQLSLRSERWQDVTGTLAWEDVDGSLEWADARKVA